MNILIAALITLGATAVTVTAMLLVRARAPEGSRFHDGDRASGVFGVLATGFSVLLGFIIFLAFSSYDEARSGRRTRPRSSPSSSRPRSSSPRRRGSAVGTARLLRALGRDDRVGGHGRRSSR
ncbi:hypothetical protein NKG05_25745 [Oerskovia sp. M15]